MEIEKEKQQPQKNEKERDKELLVYAKLVTEENPHKFKLSSSSFSFRGVDCSVSRWKS